MMTYEKGIPDFAMQPAKAPQMVSAEGIYHMEDLIYPAEMKEAEYQFEEDILVPDTKADMREILFMDACCDVSPTEKKLLQSTDDLLNLTGMITIQTIYQADGEEKIPVAISSKVPYKYQWNLQPADQGEGVFSCRVKRLEHMMINERKFRVKVTLEFRAQMFCQKDFAFFDGLKDETLEMKREPIELSCLSLVKKDEVSIDESFHPRESDRLPEQILKQSFQITENYRQITSEKVVINGFIFVNLLYLTKGDNERRPCLCAHHQRIEFTQFIPIEKAHRDKKWSAVRPTFQSRNLSVHIDRGDEMNPQDSFHIKGEIETRVALYEMRKRDMVVDAYHREKAFSCQFTKQTLCRTGDSAISELSAREVIHLPDGCKAAEAVYCESSVSTYTCTPERGRLFVTGEVESVCLWKDADDTYYTTKEKTPFRTSIEMEKLTSGAKVTLQPLMKQCWVTLINEKQLELNYTLLLCCESDEVKELVLLEEPGFVLGICRKDYPMVVVTMKPGECLWDLAKRYRTTEAQIRLANRLHDEPEAGQKLLVMK